MPKGRGRKGGKAPRKVGRGKASDIPTTVLARVSDEPNYQMPQTSHDENRQVGRSRSQNESFVVSLPMQSPQRMPQPQHQQNQFPGLPATNVTQPAASASCAYHPPVPRFTTASVLPSTSSPAMQSNPINIQAMPSTPSFPSAIPGQFMLYLLQFCPGQTSTCFG